MNFFLLRSGRKALLALVAACLAISCGHKKYETPITKNTQQPDKVLFDQAIKDIERGRYETARISLQTMMSTYESSEYMAKAKLAVADSWFREGGANGMAQAEAEYKDFILFYPNMEEAAEAQNRVCDIHFKQMDKSDRDWTQTLRAEEECRQVLVQFPNSKFAPQAAQKLREIQESLAEHEFVVGNFYWKHDMNPAAANRLNAVVDQYPLYSKAGESLYEAGDAYSKMGPRFRKTAGDMFSRVVKDYPLDPRADDAKRRLEDMEMPVPQVDQAALQREKYNMEHYDHHSLMGKTLGLLDSGPDMEHAAHMGQPTMTDPKKTIPASVPVANNSETGGSGTNGGTGTAEVSASTVGSNSALDNSPDARKTDSSGKAANGAANNQPLPTNRDTELKKLRALQAKKQAKLDKKKKKEQEKQSSSDSSAPASSGATSGTTTTAPAPASTAPSQPSSTQTTPQQ